MQMDLKMDILINITYQVAQLKRLILNKESWIVLKGYMKRLHAV